MKDRNYIIGRDGKFHLVFFISQNRRPVDSMLQLGPDGKRQSEPLSSQHLETAVTRLFTMKRKRKGSLKSPWCQTWDELSGHRMGDHQDNFLPLSSSPGQISQNVGAAGPNNQGAVSLHRISSRNEVVSQSGQSSSAVGIPELPEKRRAEEEGHVFRGVAKQRQSHSPVKT